MSGLLFLIPIALFLGLLGLIGFLWSLKTASMTILTARPTASCSMMNLAQDQNSPEIVDIGAGRSRHEQIANGVERRPCVIIGKPRRAILARFCRRITVVPSAKAPALSSEPSIPSVSAASAWI